MKIPIPHDLTTEQARIAVELLQLLIDALMDYYHALRRTYGIHDTLHEDEMPF